MKIKKIFQSIFKAIAIFIFKLIYGKVKENNEFDSNQKYFKKEINFEGCKNIYNLFEINNARLYTDRIQDTAIIKNNIIIKEASFQLRDNFSSTVNKNSVIKKGTPRFLKKLNGNVLSLLTGGGGNNNYFHWLFDVLPRIALVEKAFNLNDIDFFLCPNLNSWQLRTLNLLGIKKDKCLSSVIYRHIKAKNIIVTTHPWLMSKNVSYDIENLPTWISSWLKEKFLKLKSNKKLPKKIYIDRSDSESNLKDYRSIINEKEIVNFLIKKGFSSVRLSDLNFEDQIKLFHDADIVVGLHGAGLANLIWASTKTKIIELKSNFTNKVLENLALVNNINYNKILCRPLDKAIQEQYGTIKVDINKLSKIL